MNGEQEFIIRIFLVYSKRELLFYQQKMSQNQNCVNSYFVSLNLAMNIYNDVLDHARSFIVLPSKEALWKSL